MPRATSVLAAGAWDPSCAADSVLLDQDHRHRRRISLTTVSGGSVLLDLARPTRLRDGDGLVLDTGAILRVIAAAEPLLRITAPDPATLIRIAWHLGNRHLPTQLAPDAILIRADHVIADMVAQLGGTATPVLAPFDPEGGAYAGGRQHHHHHHDDEDAAPPRPPAVATDTDRGA